MAIKAAIFDLGGVIIDISLERIPRRLAELSGVSFISATAALLQDDLHKKHEIGDAGIEDLHRHVVKRIGKPLSLKDFEDGWNSLFLGVIDGIEPLLAGLAGKLRLVILSNTNDCHARRWRADYAPVLRHFEREFLSHEIKLRKPQPEAYTHVLDYLKLAPAEIVFIDDSRTNVKAAEQLGLAGIHAKSASQIAKELRKLGVEA